VVAGSTPARGLGVVAWAIIVGFCMFLA